MKSFELGPPDDASPRPGLGQNALALRGQAAQSPTNMKFATKAVHAGVHPDPSTGAIMTPIYQTSTYVQASPGQHKGYEYARTQNPTRDALQASLAALENGRFAYAFASGLAAIDTVLKTLSPGDEVIAANDLYGGTYRIFMRVFAKFGLKFHFIDMQSPASIEPYINANTKLIWLETPTNPLLNIIDIAAVCRLAQPRQIRVAVDNTFASPYLQNPLDLGADVVMHSVTKYIAGHSDVVMGALVTNHEAWAQEFKFLQNAVGAVPAPQDCFLVLRGFWPTTPKSAGCITLACPATPTTRWPPSKCGASAACCRSPSKTTACPTP
jgi:cystathionine gamma-lyase